MNRSIMLFFGYFGFVLTLYGQDLTYTYEPGVISPLFNFHLAIPDTSNNHIFRDHPLTKSIGVWFDGNDPEIIVVVNNPDDFASFYEMNFPGDSLVLHEKYGPIHLIPPTISSTSLLGREKQDFPTHWDISAAIYSDSVVYRSGYRTGKKPTPVRRGFAAVFTGKYENLAQEIADELRQEKIATVADSVIVIQALVKKGNRQPTPLEDLKILVGKPSGFSDIALQVLGDERNKWWPATYVSGVMGTSLLRFYIQLNPDGSVEIETPEYMDARLSRK